MGFSEKQSGVTFKVTNGNHEKNNDDLQYHLGGSLSVHQGKVLRRCCVWQSASCCAGPSVRSAGGWEMSHLMKLLMPTPLQGPADISKAWGEGTQEEKMMSLKKTPESIANGHKCMSLNYSAGKVFPKLMMWTFARSQCSIQCFYLQLAPSFFLWHSLRAPSGHSPQQWAQELRLGAYQTRPVPTGIHVGQVWDGPSWAKS